MKFPKIKPAFPLPKFPRSNKYNKQVEDDEQHESISVDYFVDAGQYSMGSIESIECTTADGTTNVANVSQKTRGLVLDSITESEEEGKEEANMELQMKASYDSYVQQWNSMNNIKSEGSADSNNSNQDTTINPNDNTSYDHALRQDTSQDSVSILRDLERAHTSTKKNSRGSNTGVSGRYKSDRTSLDSGILTKEEREVAEQELTTQMYDASTSTYDASTITTQQQQYHSQPIPLRRHSRGSNNNHALQSVKETSHILPVEHSTLHDFVEDMDAQLEEEIEEIASFNNVSKTSSKSVRLSGVSNIGDQDEGLEIERIPTIERVPTDEKNPPQEHS